MATETNTMLQKEVDAAYAAVLLKFHSYYKYCFTYIGTAEDGTTIEAVFGGCGDDIYRHEVKANDPVPFMACEEWNQVRVYSGNRQLFYWSNY